jgi:hypothetical protein
VKFICQFTFVALTSESWLSYARSAGALKELTRLIPNFQKKIDEAEPDDAQEFYNMVSMKTMVYDARSLQM